MSERTPGRPVIGMPVTVRLSDDLLDLLDEWAADERMPRARLIRRLLSQAATDHWRKDLDRRIAERGPINA